jgi:uncharacterized membrane protein
MKEQILSHSEEPHQVYISGVDIREGVFSLIQKDRPEFSRQSQIGLSDLNGYRKIYLSKLVEQERGELSRIDEGVMRVIRDHAILSENIEPEIESALTSGQRIADRVAEFGGSWTFIIFFFSFILVWMLVNVWILAGRGYDPFPFILLNLILSCLAAIQAPIIMMSQNRQEQKDRQRAEHDYKINLKAELEIKLLSEKIDHLLIYQNKKLWEIQEVQIDYLEDLFRQLDKDMRIRRNEKTEFNGKGSVL